MGICGAKVKIVAEPEQRGKTPNQMTTHKSKQRTKEKDIRSRNNSESLGDYDKIERKHQELEELEAQDEAFSQHQQRRQSKNGGYGGRNDVNQDYERNGGDLSSRVSRIEETKRVLAFKKGHIIDRGSYGEVYQCLDINTGQLYAVKTIRKNKDKTILEKEVAALAKEINEYKQLSHKNIVKYIDTELDEDEKGINIIFEFVSGGSIRQMLDKFGKFNEKVISIYTNQVLQGLNYLHQNKVIHRDIKGGNILIDTDGTIKLTDFGTLKLHKKDAYLFQNASMSYISHVQQQDSRVQRSQKPFWTAPEAFNNESLHESQDIWSVGCLVIEMITAVPPYYKELNDLSYEEVANYIKKGNPPPFPEKLSEQCREFLEKTLQADPNKRATVDELLQLKFITDPDTIELMPEQYSPNQMRSGGLRSQNSLGYGQPEFPMKQLLNQPQNGFFSDDPPQFMKENGFDHSKNRYNGNGNIQQDEGIDLQGLSVISKDMMMPKQNRDFSRDYTSQQMNSSHQKQNQSTEEHSKFQEKKHQSEQTVFDDQIKRIILDSNVHYNVAKDEYQQQLMSQLKEFEDKNHQVLPIQTVQVKKQEQKEIEDEIMELIKKKKQNRKLGIKDSTNSQQNKYQSSSTFDTSINNPPPAPQIRVQVVFNNPKDNFQELTQEETIHRNGIMLRKQYNDIQQPEMDQSPAVSQTNAQQNQQAAAPSSKFKYKEEENFQEDREPEIHNNGNGNQKSKHNQNWDDTDIKEIKQSPSLKMVQKITSQDKRMKKIESSENKLMMLQSDPLSMTSLGGFDKFQGGNEDFTLYNFKVDPKDSSKIGGKHVRSRTEYVGKKNDSDEASFFKEVRRDIPQQQTLYTEEQIQDQSPNNTQQKQSQLPENFCDQLEEKLNGVNDLHNSENDYYKSNNISDNNQEHHHQKQANHHSNNMVIEEYF